MKTTIKRIILFLVIIAVIIGIRFSPLADYLTFQALQNHKDYLLNTVQQNYIASILIYTFLYTLTVALSLPGAAIMTLGGGFLFGIFPGVLLVNIGATIGAIAAFVVVRYLMHNWVQNTYGAQLMRLNKNVKKYGTNYLLAIRLVPIFPFFLINILAALTNISLFTFAWTTSLGIIPGSLVYLFAGTQLATLKAASDLFTPGILLAFSLLGVLSLVPVVVKKYFLK